MRSAAFVHYMANKTPRVATSNTITVSSMIADYQYVKYSAYHYLYQLMDILFQEDSVKIDKHLIVVAGLGLTAAFGLWFIITQGF
jgi:hypothetical protein